MIELPASVTMIRVPFLIPYFRRREAGMTIRPFADTRAFTPAFILHITQNL